MESIKIHITEGTYCRDCKHHYAVDEDGWNVDNIHYYCSIANACIDGFYHNKNDGCVHFTQKEKKV